MFSWASFDWGLQSWHKLDVRDSKVGPGLGIIYSLPIYHTAFDIIAWKTEKLKCWFKIYRRPFVSQLTVARRMPILWWAYCSCRRNSLSSVEFNDSLGEHDESLIFHYMGNNLNRAGNPCCTLFDQREGSRSDGSHMKGHGAAFVKDWHYINEIEWK